MRLKDAYLLPSVRLRFLFETERTLLRDFQPQEPTEKEACVVVQALTHALQFLPNARGNGGLPTNVAQFLLQLRLTVQELDYGILSYSLGRALTGDLESCSAKLYETLFVQFERMTSSNAVAFHSDEYLEPEDVFDDAVKAWRIRSGATLLAMLDLSERAGCLTNQAEGALWDNLCSDEVEHVLGTLVILST